MSGESRAARTLLLAAAFTAAALSGAWLGAVAAFVFGMALSGPLRVGGEDPAAALTAAVVTAAVSTIVRRAEGRPAARGLLFVASYTALNLLFSLYFFAPHEVLCFVPPPGQEAGAGQGVLLSARQGAAFPGCQTFAPPLVTPEVAAAMLPAVLVAILHCRAEVGRSALLRYAGSIAGSIFALAGFLLSLARVLA